MKNVLCLSMLLCWLLAPRALALTDAEKLVLSKTLIAEAGERPLRDHAAILHVLLRRASLPELRDKDLAGVAMAYSAFWRREAETARGRSIHALTWERVPAWMHTLLERFASGKVRDPCRGRAWHWGSVEDAAKRTDLPQVECGGPTDNVFLGLPDRTAPRPGPVPLPLTPFVISAKPMDTRVRSPPAAPARASVNERSGAPWALLFAALGLTLVLTVRLRDARSEVARYRAGAGEN